MYRIYTLYSFLEFIYTPYSSLYCYENLFHPSFWPQSSINCLQSLNKHINFHGYFTCFRAPEDSGLSVWFCIVFFIGNSVSFDTLMASNNK